MLWCKIYSSYVAILTLNPLLKNSLKVILPLIKLKKECEGIVGEVKNKSFDSMLVELKTYISQQL